MLMFTLTEADKGAENDPKKGKTGVIRFGAIREAINRVSLFCDYACFHSISIYNATLSCLHFDETFIVCVLWGLAIFCH